jgi:hypothetical protein
MMECASQWTSDGRSLPTHAAMAQALARGMEIDKVPDEGHKTPFPGDDAVMKFYDGCPSPGMHSVSNLSLGTLAHGG